MNEEQIIKNSVFGAIHADDPRDIMLASFTPAIQVPDSYQTDMSAIPVEMQGQIGSCVAHAIATTIKTIHYTRTGELLDLTPRFLYAITKSIDGIPGQATNPATEMGVYGSKGCCLKSSLTNDSALSYSEYINLNNITPGAYQEALAVLRKVGATYAFADITEQGITQAIYQFKAVPCLMAVGNTYWMARDGSITWDAAKILPIARPVIHTDGHEICLYGYEKTNGRCKIFFRNSWSDAWADHGNGWFWLDEHIDLIKSVMAITEVPIALVTMAKNVFSTQLKLNDKNAEVKRMQTWLIAHGYSIPSGATGFYGRETKNAVWEFQRDHGIYLNLGLNFGPKCLSIINSIK